MKKIVLTLYILVSLPILILIAAEKGENTRSSYDNYDELKGTIERGWLPEYFPQSASNIEEGHNIDSNKVWATFNYKKSDIQQLKAICKTIIENENGIKLFCPPFDSNNSIFVLRFDGTGSFNRDSHGI